MFDLVGNHRNRVSCDVAQISKDFKASFMCAICTRVQTGVQIAPGVYFWPCEQCFKNLPGFKFALAFEVVQIYLHPGANCAQERKLYNFYTF